MSRYCALVTNPRLSVLQNLFNPTKSIYRALEDAKQATQYSSNGLQQPQTVVFAPYLYENYYIGKVRNPAIVILHPILELASDRRTGLTGSMVKACSASQFCPPSVQDR